MYQEHVPAWKRLGLKLRRATSDESEITLGGHRHEDIAEETVSKDDWNGAPAQKRRRIESSSASPPGSEKRVKADNAASDSKGRLKKSVSFTADTKQTDGASGMSLMEAWEFQNAAEEELLAQMAERGRDEAASRNDAESSTKGKASKQKNAVNPWKSQGILGYLSQFYNDRSAWKFNKNTDVWILKHAISTSDIPSSHEPALIEYLQGLKSEKTRTRLRDQCRDVVRAIQKSDRGGNAPGNAVEENNEASARPGFDKEGSPRETRAQDVERAKLLLLQIPGRPVDADQRENTVQDHISKPEQAPIEQDINGHTPREAPAPSMAVRRKKKKKIRTAVVEESDSTSSGGESSDQSD